MVVKLNCNLLKNIHGSMATWYNLVWPYQLFHRKTFMVADISIQTVKLFHLK